MPSLILLKSPGGLNPGHKFTLDAKGGVFVLGREAESVQFLLPNNTVSKKHAQISYKNNAYLLEDLNSRNHTFVNNKECLTPTALKNDDRIKICDFLFRFHDENVAEIKPLSADFRKVEEPDEGTDATTIEHSIQRGSAQQFLDAQPAERVRALLDISSSLSRTLDLDPLLNQIADTLFNVFRAADRCFIVLLDDNGRPVPRVVKTRRPGSTDDNRFSKTIINRCIKSQEAFLSADASEDSTLGAAMSIAEFRIRSVMVAPLATWEGAPLGAIQLDTQDRGRKFREDDLKMLAIVGNLCSVAVEKSSLHESKMQSERERNEIELAKKVQLGFLPQTLPEMVGYEFYGTYSAAQSVGGDYYDFIPLSGGRIAVVLGDVAGKGVPASLLMAKLSAEARFCMLTQTDAAKAVALLNEQLIRGGIGDRFVTLAAAIIDPVAHMVTLVNAGHINPLLYRTTTGAFAEAINNAQSGIPLGIMSGFPYESLQFEMMPGDTLLLFTDGVSDSMSPDGILFGMEGVHRLAMDDGAVSAIVKPRVLGERVMGGVRKHAAGRPQNDDIALVCFGRIDESGSGSQSSLKASSHLYPVAQP